MKQLAILKYLSKNEQKTTSCKVVNDKEFIFLDKIAQKRKLTGVEILYLRAVVIANYELNK